MYSQDLSSVVLDMGSLSTRAGFAGQDTPKFLIPTYLGRYDSTMQLEGIEKSNKFCSGDNSLNLNRERMQICPVYHQGKILDFEYYETLVKNILNNDMRFNYEEYSFLLSEDNTHNRAQREKIAQIFFESLNVKNVFFSKNAVLSCFATGRSTALVLDSGAYSTEATTVHDGYALTKTNKKCSYGGETLTQELGQYLEKELGLNLNFRSATYESNNQYHKKLLVRNMKEYVFKIDEANPGSDTAVVQYELPDRQVIKVDKTVIPDPFFTNYTADIHYRGIHHLVNDNIAQCDIDIKKELYNNVIVTGGNSLLGGFMSKLQTKLSEIMTPQKAKLINFPFPIERRFSTWIGGSILGSLASFQSFWVGKQEWTEAGISIVEKKCA